MSLRRAANNNNNIIFDNISTRRERRRIVRDFLSPSMMLFSFSFLLSLFFFFPWCWLSKNTRGESTRSTTLRADGNHHGLLVAVVTTTKDASGGRFEQWVRYHEQVGIGLFYVFVDDRTKNTMLFPRKGRMWNCLANLKWKVFEVNCFVIKSNGWCLGFVSEAVTLSYS